MLLFLSSAAKVGQGWSASRWGEWGRYLRLQVLFVSKASKQLIRAPAATQTRPLVLQMSPVEADHCGRQLGHSDAGPRAGIQRGALLICPLLSAAAIPRRVSVTSAHRANYVISFLDPPPPPKPPLPVSRHRRPHSSWLGLILTYLRRHYPPRLIFFPK